MFQQERTIKLFEECEAERARVFGEMVSEGHARGHAEASAHLAARAIWNNWADGVLKKKAELEKTDSWQTYQDIYGDVGCVGLAAGEWWKEATVDFTGITFLTEELTPPPEKQGVKVLVARSDALRFDGYIFPGHTNFECVHFLCKATFENARFESVGNFANACFESGVLLSHCKFAGRAWFGNCRFNSVSKFEGVEFCGIGGFLDTVFGENATFQKSVFHKQAWFEGAKFLEEAHFASTGFKSGCGFQGVNFRAEVRFQGAEFGDTAGFEGAKFYKMAGFQDATFASSAWFSRTEFKAIAGFEGVKFDEDAIFGKVQFGGEVWFEPATFRGSARFEHAIFTKVARFRKAQFKKEARFDQARFHEAAEFSDALFKGNGFFEQVTFARRADFSLARFQQFVTFARSHFQSSADFGAIRGGGGFSLENSAFETVPDFIQAHFEEAPRLDRIDVRARMIRRKNPKKGVGKFRLMLSCPVHAFKEVIRRLFSADANTPARFRALKRLAIEGHDSDREHEFFSREIRSARFVTDWPIHWRVWRSQNVAGIGRFWFGFAYEEFGGLGSSLRRPALWWLTVTLIASTIYLGENLDVAKERSRYVMEGNMWSVAHVYATYDAIKNTQRCYNPPPLSDQQNYIGGLLPVTSPVVV